MSEIDRLEKLKQDCKHEAFMAARAAEFFGKDYNEGRKQVLDTMVIRLGGLKIDAEKEPKPAAGPWRTDEPPKDEREFIGIWVERGIEILCLAKRSHGCFWVSTNTSIIDPWQRQRPVRWAEINAE